jgi:hypothetical protein
MTRSQMNSITDSRFPCSSNSTDYPVPASSMQPSNRTIRLVGLWRSARGGEAGCCCPPQSAGRSWAARFDAAAPPFPQFMAGRSGRRHRRRSRARPGGRRPGSMPIVTTWQRPSWWPIRSSVRRAPGRWRGSARRSFVAPCRVRARLRWRCGDPRPGRLRIRHRGGNRAGVGQLAVVAVPLVGLEGHDQGDGDQHGRDQQREQAADASARPGTSMTGAGCSRPGRRGPLLVSHVPSPGVRPHGGVPRVSSTDPWASHILAAQRNRPRRPDVSDLVVSRRSGAQLTRRVAVAMLPSRRSATFGQGGL